MKSRFRSKHLIELSNKKIGRIIVITGARQVGKSTLLKKAFPEYTYISLDDPLKRESYSRWTSDDFLAHGNKWIIDEAQKMPSIFETVKSIYDSTSDSKFILSGSSQIMLLDKVRESLAGRAIVLEMFPLTIPEIVSEGLLSEVKDSILIQFLKSVLNAKEISTTQPILNPEYAKAKKIVTDSLQYGQMPAIYSGELTHEDYNLWLENYVSAYLQRTCKI